MNGKIDWDYYLDKGSSQIKLQDNGQAGMAGQTNSALAQGQAGAGMSMVQGLDLGAASSNIMQQQMMTSGTYIIPYGTTLDRRQEYIQYYQSNWGPNPYTFNPPPSDAHHEAEDFMIGIADLRVKHIKELILTEDLYNQIMAYMGTDIENYPEYKKELPYEVSHGTIILKNEKYQFDLDKYLEDGKTEEI